MLPGSWVLSAIVLMGPASLRAEDGAPIKPKVKAAAKELGQAVKDGAKEIKPHAKKAGKAVKAAAKDVKDGLKDAFKD
jgi:hypothetical protein